MAAATGTITGGKALNKVLTSLLIAVERLFPQRRPAQPYNEREKAKSLHDQYRRVFGENKVSNINMPSEAP